jgi:hypothetical protein
MLAPQTDAPRRFSDAAALTPSLAEATCESRHDSTPLAERPVEYRSERDASCN